MKVSNTNFEPFAIRAIAQSFSNLITDNKTVELLNVIIEDIYGIDNVCSSILNPSSGKFNKIITKNRLFLDNLYNMTRDKELINVVMRDLILIKLDIIKSTKDIKKHYNRGDRRKAKKATKSLKQKEKIYTKVIKVIKQKYGGIHSMKEVYNNMDNFMTYGRISLLDDDDYYDEYDEYDTLERYADGDFEIADDMDIENAIESLGIGLDLEDFEPRPVHRTTRPVSQIRKEVDPVPIKISVDNAQYASQLADIRYSLMAIMKALEGSGKDIRLDNIDKSSQSLDTIDNDEDIDETYDMAEVNIKSIDDIIDIDMEAEDETYDEETEKHWSNMLDTQIDDDEMTQFNESEAGKIRALFALDRDKFVKELSATESLSESQIVNLIEIYDKANKTNDNSTIISAYNNKKNSDGSVKEIPQND